MKVVFLSIVLLILITSSYSLLDDINQTIVEIANRSVARVEEAIKRAENRGVRVGEEKLMLEDAKRSFDDGNYSNVILTTRRINLSLSQKVYQGDIIRTIAFLIYTYLFLT